MSFGVYESTAQVEERRFGREGLFGRAEALTDYIAEMVVDDIVLVIAADV